jgi:hypothetical protein
MDHYFERPHKHEHQTSKQHVLEIDQPSKQNSLINISRFLDQKIQTPDALINKARFVDSKVLSNKLVYSIFLGCPFFVLEMGRLLFLF